MIRQLCSWGARRYLWVIPTVRLDVLKNTKFSCRCRESIPWTSCPQPGHYTDWTIPASSFIVRYTKLYRQNTDDSTKLAGPINRELGYIYLLSMQVYFIYFLIVVVFFCCGLFPTMSSLKVTTKLGVWRQLTVRLEVCYEFWTDNEAIAIIG
jgi:hypothetical protein